MIRKPIPGFPEYEASDDGHVYNARDWQLSTYDCRGYRFIALKNEHGARVNVGVHRLVVAAFLGPIPKGMWVNHKNGIKHDNRLENLEITTPSENHCHARDVLKRTWAKGGNAVRSQLSEEAVGMIRFLHSHGYSQHALSRAFLVSQPTIHNLLKQVTWREDGVLQ